MLILFTHCEGGYQLFMERCTQEGLEDTKGVIRSCKSKKNYIQYNGQKEEGQTTIYKALHRKHEPH
jgi:hypothetical protein